MCDTNLFAFDCGTFKQGNFRLLHPLYNGSDNLVLPQQAEAWQQQEQLHPAPLRRLLRWTGC